MHNDIDIYIVGAGAAAEVQVLAEQALAALQVPDVRRSLQEGESRKVLAYDAGLRTRPHEWPALMEPDADYRGRAVLQVMCEGCPAQLVLCVVPAAVAARESERLLQTVCEKSWRDARAAQEYAAGARGPAPMVVVHATAARGRTTLTTRVALRAK